MSAADFDLDDESADSFGEGSGDAMALKATFELEQSELQLGNGPICGVDEAGRGPWAGPVVAAAVILDPDTIPAGIADSVCGLCGLAASVVAGGYVGGAACLLAPPSCRRTQFAGTAY